MRSVNQGRLLDEDCVENDTGVRVIHYRPSVVVTEDVSRGWRSKQRYISLRQRLYLTVPIGRQIDSAVPRPALGVRRMLRMGRAVMFLQVRSILCAEMVVLVSSSFVLLLLRVVLGTILGRGCERAGRN